MHFLFLVGILTMVTDGFSIRKLFPKTSITLNGSNDISSDALTQKKNIEEVSRNAVWLAGDMIAASKIDLSRDVTSKIGSRDIVTDVDKKAQEIIKSTILDRFPHHTFLGEEDIKPGNLRYNAINIFMSISTNIFAILNFAILY